MPALDDIVAALGMKPHPEGGFFVETYRAPHKLTSDLGPRFPPGSERSLLTAIHYALPGGGKSALHRIASDELWAWHAGGPLVVIELTPSGDVIRTVLGPDVVGGHRYSYVVAAGRWFGSYAPADVEFAVVSCVVAPGFDFRDWSMDSAQELRAAFPTSADLDDVLSFLAKDATGAVPAGLPRAGGVRE